MPKAPVLTETLAVIEGKGKFPSTDSTLYSRKWIEDLAEGQRHSVTGVTVVLKRGHSNGFYDFLSTPFDARHDPEKPSIPVREAVIACDTLEVHDRVWLPECDLFVHARKIVFQGEGAFDVSAMPYATDSALAANEQKARGDDGKDGRNAGTIRLYAAIVDHATRIPVIRACGANGQHAGKGLDGADGASVRSFSEGTYSWDESGMKTWEIHPTFNPPAVFVRIIFERTWPIPDSTFTRGAEHWPTDGKDAKAPGKPGEPGNGGDVFTNVSAIATLSMLDGGGAGRAALPTRGGRAGSPQRCAHYEVRASTPVFGDSKIESTTAREIRETKPGKDAAAPAATRTWGTPGKVSVKQVSNAWLHPLSCQQVLIYLRNAYLAGHLDTVRSLLADYDEAFRLPQPKLDGYAPWEQATALDYPAARVEVTTLSSRIGANLDYFGNPAGYMPLLSLPGTLRLFDMEAETALRTMLLSQWVSKEHNAAQSAAEIMKAAMETARKSVAAAAHAMAQADKQVVDASESMRSLVTRIEDTTGRISVLKEELLNKARNKAEIKAQIRAMAKIAGAVCMVIPVGQPFLGIAGQLAANIADYDPDKPSASIDKVKEAVNSATTALQKSRDAAKEAADKKEKEEEELAKELAKKINESPDTRPRSDALTAKPQSVEDAAKAKAKADAKAARDARDAQWKTVGENMGSAVSTTLSAFSGLRVPQSEIDAELAKLIAASDDWKKLANELKALNEQKAEIFAKLTRAIQAIGEGYGVVSAGSAAIATLGRNRSSRISAIDPEAVLVIQRMNQQAELSLLGALYQMSKAYETTVYEPADTDWSLTEVTKKIGDLLTSRTGFDPGLIQDYVKTLLPIYRSEQQKLRGLLLKNYDFNGAKEMPLEFGLSRTQTPDHIDQINTQGRTEVDPLAMGLILPSYDRHRLVNVDLKLEFETPPERMPASGNMEVRLILGEAGIMRSGKQLYGVRRDKPCFWSWIFKFSGGPPQPTRPSLAATELLNQLLDDGGNQLTGKLALPALWSSMTVDVQFSSLGWETPRPLIKSLIFNCSIDAVANGDRYSVLRVATNNPYATVTCSPEDAASRGPGRISLYRIYDKGTPVNLGIDDGRQAEGSLPLSFKEWQIIGTSGTGGPSRRTDRNIREVLNGHKIVECAFTTDPSVETAAVAVPGAVPFLAKSKPMVAIDSAAEIESADLDSLSAVRDEMPDLPVDGVSAGAFELFAGPGEEFDMIGITDPDLQPEVLPFDGPAGWRKILSGGMIGYAPAPRS
ncbi:hypothetical protein JL100_002485 [Skermanella mucosa]|uniref:hypothetical protein n=1 Tax=Skermanella mucosa TaxID=1789672 RepID=UPI00192CC1A1|nr:hypothetical protein [Skermanella mucosa]UEM21659.1 hypothetical protein JL100_002485 [Skermanella mucosa]